MKSAAQFLNVDLDIESGEDLAQLARAFEDVGAVVLTCHKTPTGVLFLSVECEGTTSGAEDAIRKLIALIRLLPEHARCVFDRARARVFNIGVAAGATLPVFTDEVEAATIASVASFGAGIVLTVYPHGTNSANEEPSVTG